MQISNLYNNPYSNRFELKYLISIKARDEIIKAITPFMVLDKNVAKNKSGYNVTSLYFDTSDYQSYYQKIDGEKNRIKLRMRTYGDSPYKMCSLEMKIKHNNNVVKERIFIEYQKVDQLLSMMLADNYSYMKDFSGEDLKVISKVQKLITIGGLRAKSIIRYYRIPYVGIFDSQLRLTFDVNLKIQKNDLRLHSPLKGKRFLPFDQSVMEVKYTSRIPLFMLRILNQFNLELTKVSKYCLGLEKVIEL